MTRSNPDLIVPIRDRRHGKRILTLKNVRNVTLVAVVLFIALTVVSELRRPKESEDYGRLFGKQIAVPETATQRAPEVVTEAPAISDQEHADPLLLSAAAREQYLGVNQPLTAATVVPVTTTDDFSRPAPVLGSGQRVSVVGDANGVAITTSTQERGTLGGGIFKPR